MNEFPQSVLHRASAMKTAVVWRILCVATILLWYLGLDTGLAVLSYLIVTAVFKEQ